MGLEIERKFLVKGEFKSMAVNCTHITQGYLSVATGKTVRVRIRDTKAYLTIKGPSSADGLSRFEWEEEIKMEDALAMMQLCGTALVDKHRYLVPFEGHTFEIDEFHGENEGLLMAEVELKNPDEEVVLPPFIGIEVSRDRRYYNSQLLQHPYSQWKDA